ncbi:MAG: NAD(P)H-dependent oxidoreductase [Deltaproteobacteria bacterium]|jgi:chromate reductase|nr:NAD(P)H-dependent oxidoreductase [Deltaproteobacteria bacterium]
MYNIAVIVGSLSAHSINRKLAEGLMDMGRELFAWNMLSLQHVPLLNQDMEADLPASVRGLKDAVAGADGVLLVTPEHNRQMPAVLKNAVDWCSRPYGRGQWMGKPLAITGISPGAVGTAVAQAQLRALLSLLGGIVMPFPEVCLAAKPGFFDTSGALADESTRSFLMGFLNSFARWIAAHPAAKASQS